MTQAVLEVLRGEATPNGGVATLQTLWNHAQKSVPARAKEANQRAQTPVAAFPSRPRSDAIPLAYFPPK